MNEKEIMIEQEEILTTQQVEAEQTESAENEKPSLVLKNIIDDGNDLVYAEMPQTKQQEHLRQMRKAIRARQVCYGRIYAIEENSEDFILRILVKKDSLKVVISASDFFALSEFEGDIKNDTEEERFMRYRRRASHMLGAAISFIPLQIIESADGVPIVAASRKAAMEKNQEKYFFEPGAQAEVGTVAKASIISVAPRYITVECLGVEATMGTGALSAYNYIEDASLVYETGEGIMVAIEKLNVDKENKKLEVSFSHSAIERESVKSEKVNDSMIKGRYDGVVVGEKGNYYIVILTGPKIRGLIPMDHYRGVDKLMRGDKVSVLVEDYNEKRNNIIGSCMRR